jgi:peptidoglycan/LPS O-acetylase OafA/YrhL
MTFPGGGEQREALVVHGFAAPEAWLYLTPLRLAVSGPAAVLLFFVLSGFVLTKSVTSDRAPSYGAFAISRFVRIWHPFAVAITASVLLSSFLAARPAPGTSAWFTLGTWHEPLTLGSVGRHLAMTGTATDLDNPMWSLVHELRISFLFPLLVLLTLRARDLTLAATLLMSFACIAIVGGGGLPGLTLSCLQTGTYVYFFVIGIMLATRTDEIRARLASWSKPTIAGLWVVALAALTLAPADTSHVTTFRDGALLLVSGAGAGLVIALCVIGGAAERVLLARIPRFLGRISYSLYLTHLIVIAAVIHTFAGAVQLAVALAVALPLSLIVADICQRLVEAPGQQLGKRLAAWVDRRRDVAAVAS